MTTSNMQGHFSIDGIRIEYGFAVEAKGQSVGWVKQVHGTDALEVAQPTALPQAAVAADAVLTRLLDKEIYVFTADCLPVLLAGVDPDGVSHLAAIHSGWRGAMRGIVPAVLKHWAIPLKRTIAILGPSIGPCHFEVKQDFVDEFSKATSRCTAYLHSQNDRRFFDLAQFVAREQLSGIPPSNLIFKYQRCTYCSEPTLPSYRRNQGTDPQIRAWIQSHRTG